MKFTTKHLGLETWTNALVNSPGSLSCKFLLFFSLRVKLLFVF